MGLSNALAGAYILTLLGFLGVWGASFILGLKEKDWGLFIGITACVVGVGILYGAGAVLGNLIFGG